MNLENKIYQTVLTHTMECKNNFMNPNTNRPDKTVLKNQSNQYIGLSYQRALYYHHFKLQLGFGDPNRKFKKWTKLGPNQQPTQPKPKTEPKNPN
jgi:hypothetical protein